MSLGFALLAGVTLDGVPENLAMGVSLIGSASVTLLVQHFTQRRARQCNKTVTSLTVDTMNKLRRYHVPGNVRELENFIERSVIFSQGATLNAPLSELRHAGSGTTNANTLEEIERQHILRTLEESNWVITGLKAAPKNSA